MFYVYVLRSLKDNKYYFGQTNDPRKRFKLHNLGKVRSTEFRRPFVILGFKKFETRDAARWYEYNLKHHGDRKLRLLKELGVL
jgi:putative endonuclease